MKVNNENAVKDINREGKYQQYMTEFRKQETLNEHAIHALYVLGRENIG